MSKQKNHHTNRLAQAPVYAGQIHTSLKNYPNCQFVFDPYGHDEQVDSDVSSSACLAQNGKSNKRFIPWLLQEELVLFNQVFLSFIWVPYRALMIKLKMMIRIAG